MKGIDFEWTVSQLCGGDWGKILYSVRWIRKSIHVSLYQCLKPPPSFASAPVASTGYKPKVYLDLLCFNLYFYFLLHLSFIVRRLLGCEIGGKSYFLLSFPFGATFSGTWGPYLTLHSLSSGITPRHLLKVLSGSFSWNLWTEPWPLP